MEYTIREMAVSEYPLLNDFLYEAIFIPDGIELPPRNIIASPELQIYVDRFGASKDDFSLVNEALNLFKYPVRENGHWLKVMNVFEPKAKELSCSECGHQIGLRFCPNCGADMRGEEE